MRVGTVVIRHELQRARDIAQAAFNASSDARVAHPGNAPYLAALERAAADCQRAIVAFNDAIRISEESEDQEAPARSGPAGSDEHSSTPAQAAPDRTSTPAEETSA